MELHSTCIALRPSRSPPFIDTPPRWRRPLLCLASSRSEKVSIENGPRNSRFIFASLNVDAPVDALWNHLTDYDRLDEFIPSLAENECLERKPTGAILKQVGQQNLALGVKFCASVVLEIGEHVNGLNERLCWTNKNEGRWDEGRWFPSPGFIDGPRPRDITFELIRGDFQAFKGLWRMQSNRRHPETTRLSYSLFVRPQLWLPVALIQGMICAETMNNLRALKAYTEGSRIGV